MDSSFFNVLLSTTCSRCSSWQPMMEPAFLTSLLDGWCHRLRCCSPSRQWQSAAHWPRPLGEHLQHLAAHVEGSKLPQEKELTPPLLEHSVDVGLPVQSMETPRYWSSSTMYLSSSIRYWSSSTMYLSSSIRYWSSSTRYWSSSTMSTSTPRTLRGGGAVAFLLKSTTISLVLATFSRRWFSSAHFTKSLTTALSSSSRPSLIHPTTAESSEYFCRWHDSVLYWKSLVYRVKRKGDRTVPCGLQHH
ncbi:uncharacterized protein LOC130191099 [Pseudoliparis swirei]|uniref:uncharacterized protein LOC130191099 n=1 Tax=Pseudoliparis swirei TaxID=2059687 RepID=UPI0024BEB22E|nr:uncharacterized protein LOC130191099 [Pseudoliparis swirei]